VGPAAGREVPWVDAAAGGASGGRAPPDGGWATPADGCAIPADGWAIPDGGWAIPDGGWAIPDGGWAIPDSGWAIPDSGWAILADGWAIPDGGCATPVGGHGRGAGSSAWLSLLAARAPLWKASSSARSASASRADGEADRLGCSPCGSTGSNPGMLAPGCRRLSPDDVHPGGGPAVPGPVGAATVPVGRISGCPARSTTNASPGAIGPAPYCLAPGGCASKDPPRGGPEYAGRCGPAPDGCAPTGSEPNPLLPGAAPRAG
jgi:hypothetical protein